MSELTAMEIREKLAEITHCAWSDDEFRKRLATEPDKIAEEFGLTTRKGLKVHFHVDTKDEKNFSIPLRPEYMQKDLPPKLEQELRSLARLHAEVACTTSWVQSGNIA